METINREDILRMIGLRDSAGLYSKINSLMIDMYDEGGKLAEYSTQILQTEKNITLLAQRVTDDETDIADLTVTAQQISQTVEHQQDEIDSVTGTVNGHTTQIGQLQTTAQQITASVSSLTTTVNGHTQRIGELVIKDNEISQRVSVVEGDYVKNAQISLMVKYDPNTGYISNASIKADNIDFTFTRATNFISGGQTVMSIDTGGNLWIKGEYRGGSITGNITIGTGTNKMYIRPNETDGAELVGYYGNYQTILLGFGAEKPAQGVTANVGRLTLSSYVSGSLYRKSVLGPGHFSIYDSSNNIIAQFSAGNNLINGNITVYRNGTTYSGVTRDITIGGTTLKITSGIITYVS